MAGKSINLDDPEQLYARMEKISDTGWCVADFTDREIRLSKHLAERLGATDGGFTFDRFLELLTPAYRHHLRKDAAGWDDTQSYDQTFLLHTVPEPLWMHVKLAPLESDARGHRFCAGSLRILEKKDYERYAHEAYKVELSDLLQSQRYISNLLLKLLVNPDIDSIINEILMNIIDKFDADRSYIFSFNLQKQTHNCAYEVTKEGISSEIGDLQNIPISGTQWWCDQILEKNTIILGDIQTLKTEHPVEFETLDSQSIKSLMVVPLLSAQGVWGYIGVDIVGHNRTWSHTEQQWFEAISNYISVCIELHRTLDNVQRSSETVRSIYRYLPIGVELYDTDGNLEEINEADMAIFQVPDRAGLQERNLFRHPVIPREQIRELRRGHEFTIDVSHTFNNDSRDFYNSRLTGRKELYLKCKLLYGSDHMVEHYLLMTIDNTTMLQAYNKMHEFESLFDTISEFAEVGFFRWNLTTKELFATNQWYKNMGIKPLPEGERYSGDFILSHLHPEDKEDFLGFIQDALSGGEKTLRHELRIKDRKEWKWLRCRNMISCSEEKPDEIILLGLNDNITKAKEVEQHLLEAKTKAEESDRLKSAFLANMSHEIRTPLNAIVGFSSILAESTDPEEREQFISIIQQNNEQLLQLIADILDLSKIEAGIVDVTYGMTDINPLCSNLVNSVAVKVQEGVVMSFEPGLPDLQLYTDRSRLTQVLSNYLNNAAKFTSSGSITLSYAQQGEMIEFRVEDSGIGMSAEECRTAFNRFEKFNSFASGTGLGLSICKSIAEKLEGEVGVESEPGKGSCFWIRVPNIASAEEQKKIQEAPQASPKEQSSRRKSILVAEDSESNILLITKVLERKYDLRYASNGREVLEMYKEQKPDLILMDIKMPEMDGLEATEIIRQIDTDTPILAISDFAEDDDRDKVLATGCNEYLAKPVIADALHRAIKRHI